MSEANKKTCALCKSVAELTLYTVPPVNGKYPDNELSVCTSCFEQLEKKTELNPEYWHFLSDAMWSENAAVQVVAWRMLRRLKQETWATDLLDMLYLDEETLAWAQAYEESEPEEVGVHQDSNGQILQNGDSVVLTKTLDVKGSSLNAKLGTVVKNIRLVEDNTDQIEGKIEGQTIVILTKYLRKQS